jgi:hypothetical protein
VRLANALATVNEVPSSAASARLIVLTPKADSRASSAAQHTRADGELATTGGGIAPSQAAQIPVMSAQDRAGANVDPRVDVESSLSKDADGLASE